MLRFFASTPIFALLIACTTPPPQLNPVGTGSLPAPPKEAPVAQRPIPSDSLYPLLLAEFALRRQVYDVALQQYMEQSTLLRDAGISAHTTHLTQFLQREAQARQAAQLWVELDPNNTEANNTLAELRIREGKPLAALPCLAVVERQSGNANFPALAAGFTQLNPADQAKLAQGVAKLATEFPDNTRILLTQALFYAESNAYEQALAKLNSIFALEPQQPQALLLEARILVASDQPKPYARIERVLRENPDASALRLQYAGLLAATDMRAARAQFEILSSQAPQDGDLLFSLALINREMGDNAAAAAYLRQAITLGQRADEAHYYLGRMAENANAPEEAIAHYQQVKYGEEYLAAASRIGQILLQQGQLTRSLTWFEEQRKHRPAQREQLYGLEAEILVQADHDKEAMQVLDKALEETPGSAPLRYARAMLSEKQDDLVAMERELRAILATEPNNATALNALGYTLADRTTRFTEALQLISRALALQPNEPAILDSMGWVLFRTGRYNESVTYLRRAYGEFPDPEVAAHLGEVLWTQGDTDAAMAIWQEALQRSPDHPILISTMGRLGVDTSPPTRPPGSPGAMP